MAIGSVSSNTNLQLGFKTPQVPRITNFDFLQSQQIAMPINRRSFSLRLHAALNAFCEKLKHILEVIFGCCFNFVEDEAFEFSSPSSPTANHLVETRTPREYTEVNELLRLSSEEVTIANEYFSIRENLIKQTTELALKLDLADLQNCFEPKGNPNITGGNCYMNAALQSLEDQCKEYPEFISLVQSNLSLENHETLTAFEKRKLSLWNPLSIVFEDNDQQKNFKQKIANQYNQLENLKERDVNTIKKRISIFKKINDDLRFLQENFIQDAILFKWSFLLFMKAKWWGNFDYIEQALRLHHDVCFGLKNNQEFFEESNIQKDSASYFELWHDMFNNKIPMRTYRLGMHLKQTIQTDGIIEPISLLQVEIPSHRELKCKDLSRNLLGLIGYTMTDVITEENGGLKNPCYFEKLKVYKTNYRIEQRFTCAPPDHLTIHIKRFGGSKQTYYNHCPVKLGFNPNERAIDMRMYFANQRANYSLASFIAHKGGSLEAGHYVAYVKDKNNESWRKYDDRCISEPLNFKEIPFEEAYILNFRRLKT